MPKLPTPVLADEEIKEVATFVVKRFRKFLQSEKADSNATPTESQSSTSFVFIPASSKAPGLPVPTHCNMDNPVRLSEPPVQLIPAKGLGKQFIRVPSYPVLLAKDLSYARQRVANRCLTLDPRLAASIIPPAQPTSPHHETLWTHREHFAEPNPAPRYTHELTLPRKAQVVLPTTSQLQGQARMRRCLAKFSCNASRQ